MPILYRAFRDDIGPGLHRNPFAISDRKPKNIPCFVHAVADRWFDANFGIRARSRSLMCSTDLDQARAFSKFVYWIVPRPPYNVVYSEQVRDFMDIVVAGVDLRDGKQIVSWLEGCHYEVARRVDGIEPSFRGEVMLVCEEFEAQIVASGGTQF